MFRSALLAWSVVTSFQAASAAPIGHVDGTAVEGRYVIEGHRVVLNGAALRKRALFNTDVLAVYLSEKRATLAGLESAPGAKRLQQTVLRDVPGAMIWRYFIADFKAVASEAEVKQLIHEISYVGSLYGGIHQLNKGDVVNMDWVPDKGMQISLNGKVLSVAGGPPYLDNPLMYKVMLRMALMATGSNEFRDNLLGKSRSMLTVTSGTQY